jgi:PAS domain S-box-containing protein
VVPILLPAKLTQKALVAGDYGNIWVGGMSTALTRIEGNTWKDIRPDLGTLYGVRDWHGTIWLLNYDLDSRLTIHSYVSRLAKERPIFVAATPAGFDLSGSRGVLGVDRMGTLWLGAGPLFFLKKNGQWEQFETPSEVAAKTALVTFTDPDGRIWFGFTDNTILVMDGTNVRTFSAKDGIQVGTVRAITGRDRHIWIGGEGGLAVWNEDRFRAVLPAGSDAFHGVSGVQEDSGGDVFLSEERGVVFIPATEVSKILKNPSARVQYQLFDVHDGVPGAVQQTTPYPTSVQGTDGRIWFSTSTGVAWIDPAHIPKNLLEPPITIRSITANGTGYTSPAGLRLPPRTRDLTIDYTALSLAVPDRVRFRYKLEGSDTQWQDAGGRRQAFYTNLSPREYRFRVTASNNDGVWNEAGASLSFVIAPAWYQTTWFRGLCVLAFFTLLWGGYQMRVHQLQEQEKKFRDAVETMPALAFVADPKGNHTFMNRGWLEYTGLSPEEASESGWEKTIHPDDLNRHTERWRASDTTGQPLDYEARLRRGSDGVYRWFLIRAVPVRDKHGKIVKWCGAATDIEEREKLRQLEADLAHINRVSTLGEMAASLAHEIKQPIAAAITSANSCIEWLAHEPPNLDRARAAAARIDKYGNRAAEIIDRIRSVYKKSPPQRELVDVNGIVHEILALMRAEATRYPIAMRAELTTDLPKIMADPVQLQQVFMNLVLNAIEAMKDSGGELTVKSELGNDGRAVISVSDTGVGLPAGKVDEIFSAFFTTKVQGSGMGLAISRSIVESHGGRLWATANNGRGATFHVTLPIAAEVVRVSDTGT